MTSLGKFQHLKPLLISILKGAEVVDSLFLTNFIGRLLDRASGFHNPDYRFKVNQTAVVHLPKTAGTSLHNLLKKDKLQRFVNLDSHRPVSQCCSPENYSYLTVMRDPVSRVWSYYQMVMRSHGRFPYKASAKRGLKCFLKHCWEVRNMACRYYSGWVFKEPDKITLSRAVENISHFAYVLSFEHIQDELCDISKKYDIQGSIPHERISSYRAPNNAERNLIHHFNSLDIELYDKWKQLRGLQS